MFCITVAAYIFDID